MNRKNIKSKIKPIIIYFTVIVLATVFIPILLGFILSTNHPMAAVSSNSMLPTLTRGDLIFLENTRIDDIKIGDIVGYYNDKNSGFAIHRVVNLTGNFIITKGDANIVLDNPIHSDYIIGKAVTINGNVIKIPYLGYISILTNNALNGENS